MSETEKINIELEKNPLYCLEKGKEIYLDEDKTAEERAEGLRLLNKAVFAGNSEAQYILASLILEGKVKSTTKNSLEYALELLQASANNGFSESRERLNRICEMRYRIEMQKYNNECNEPPLVDFNGRKIVINRTGALHPVDAVLEYKNGENVLTLSLDVSFVDTDTDIQIEDFDAVCDSVIDGIMEWQGSYTVFGGQKLKVVIELTFSEKTFDSVYVFPMTAQMGNQMLRISKAVGTKGVKRNVNDIIRYKRSFATVGLRKWKVKNRKLICIQSKKPGFTDYDEIMHVAKHEFGHVLGLGDLYCSPQDKYKGVEKGTFKELDCYHITDKMYNLVMCDHHEPISNNDIEMVVLAFAENKMQNYQPSRFGKKISMALGRGN